MGASVEDQKNIISKMRQSLLDQVKTWTLADVLLYLKNNNLAEYRTFCEEKNIDGVQFLSLSESVVEKYNSEIDFNNLIKSIHELKSEPEKFLDVPTNMQNDSFQIVGSTSTPIEIKTIESSSCTKICVPNNKSFLYCPKIKMYLKQTDHYLPMTSKFPEKLRNPSTDGKYYEIESCTHNAKRKSENCYEELNFDNFPEPRRTSRTKGLLRRIWRKPQTKKETKPDHIITSKSKRRLEIDSQPSQGGNEKYKQIDDFSESSPHYYEINFPDESIECENICYSKSSEQIKVDTNNYLITGESANQKRTIAVEDYLEPRKCFPRGCVDDQPNHCGHDDDTLQVEMLHLFDETMKKAHYEINTGSCDDFQKEHKIEDDSERSTELQKPFESIQKWNESLKNAKRKKDIAELMFRPLPVPIENEFYYMEVDRKEAEGLLEGQPNGTFILRPSTQNDHAYTLTLTYEGRVYNIGCRKRKDGRLALGFSKIGEPNFLTVHELIDYYYAEKLVILVDGKKVGSTALKRLHP